MAASRGVFEGVLGQELLVKLALGSVEKMPFVEEELAQLKSKVVRLLAGQGFQLKRSAQDRGDVPIDFRFLQLLLQAAEDPEVGPRRVRCGGARRPGPYWKLSAQGVRSSNSKNTRHVRSTPVW